ncbi:multiple inositol polyphosphate phosphatase 1-like [Adelges cooleyi]|uniref:multiple inositol polyphosphate phosphatase 1-like n=1 Tax=Adelges cooleyi TaxID=133065 RepID=UPI00218093CD|nr:multiple inositol polyphosphate phosphatase 1-like [Adelges cooleyi]
MATSLFEMFRTKTEGRSSNGPFHFGNAHNILHLYVILGLAKDSAPLKSTNYNNMEDRYWRTSKMVPWIANFMAVLFKSNSDEYYIAFYFNEKLTTITLNDGSKCEKCRWADIQNLFMTYIRDNQC